MLCAAYKGNLLAGSKLYYVPERTHWIPSKKLDTAMTSIILATYVTTSSTLLYA